MHAYLIRRLGISSITLLLITFIVFALIRNIPGTPLTMEVAMADPSRKINPEDLKRLEKAYGLDKPWPQAYATWLGNLVQGDMGRSFHYKRAVTEVISTRIGPTLILSMSSLMLTYLLAIPMGLYATARSGLLQERIASTSLYML
jgi:peptide/nickel transport system permease protein